ncbi:DUF6338 family protein [Kroppenstedtia sanguinis]|uniref:DUF6338 family protein n=1 Tax=Kroppenstedtia sanguinis TaxID=1380684 RepID=A0ABW4CAN0_9BACL
MSLNIFENIDTLSLFLLFLIPGFISIRVYDTLIPGENRDYSKSLVELIGYSTLNFILLSPLIYWMSIAVWWVQWILLIALVILFPILWPLVIIWLKKLGSG